MMRPYDDLRLTVERQSDGSYDVYARGPGAAGAHGRFERPDDRDVQLLLKDVLNFVLLRQHGGEGTRGSTELAAPMKEFGQRLFRQLFDGDVAVVYHRAYDDARRAERNLRIYLDLTNAAELGGIPWECLYDRGRFMSVSDDYSLVRYLELPSEPLPLKVAPPLRILAAASSPRDCPRLDLEQERDNLKTALADLAGLVEVSWAPAATWEAIHDAASQLDFHIFHFIGHGHYEERTGEGQILLEDERGDAMPCGGTELSTMLESRSLRLAVLNACEGARSPDHDPFAGVAASLLQRDVPGVVAMQFKISDEAAVRFSQSFYRRLAQGYPVDAALTYARKRILLSGNPVEWATPVLFMRAPDGCIFDVVRSDGEAAVSAPRETEPEPPVEPEPPFEPEPPVEPEPPAEPELAAQPEIPASKLTTAQARRNRLVELARDQVEVARRLGLADEADRLGALAERLASSRFKVLVMGDFSRGKSTFINALLGQRVLPVGVSETTGVITEVRWGDEPRAFLHRREPAVVQDVPVAELAHHIVVDQDLEDYRSPYRLVEVHWPLELCRNDVEIIDSPGLNAHELREQLVVDYLREVDAVVFVMSCQQLATKEEREVIERDVLPNGHEDLFFVLNWMNMVPPESLDDVRRRARRLARFTRDFDTRVFLVDARRAGSARERGDPIDWEASGVRAVEEALEHFLAVDRARMKIMPPAGVLRRIVRSTAETVLPERRTMLSLDLEALEARAREADEGLRAAQRERDAVLARLDATIAQTAVEVGDRAGRFYSALARSIPEWADEFVPTTKLKLIDAEASGQAMVDEIAEHVNERCNTACHEWLEEELRPFVAERAATLTHDFDGLATDFLRQIDAIRGRLVRQPGRAEPVPRAAPPSERVLAAAAAYLETGPATRIALEKPELPAAGWSIAAWSAVAAATVLASGVAFLAAPALGAIGAKREHDQEQATKKIKATAGSGLADGLSAVAPALGRELADAATRGLHDARDLFSGGLDAEIAGVREQMSAVLEAKRDGEATVRRRLDELAATTAELERAGSELDAIIAEVDVG